MSAHYHDPADLKLFRDLKGLAGAEFEAWAGLDKIVRRQDGRIPLKFRHLIAVGVALTTQCAYCIEVHTGAAKKAGATREELAEVVFLAAALNAGAAAAHGTMALKLFDAASA